MTLTVPCVLDLNPTDRSLLHRLSILSAGWVLISLGVVGVLNSRLGAGPFEVLNVGVAARLGVQVGTASWVTMGVMITAATLLGARPGPATFASSFFVGGLINILLGLVMTPDSLVARSLMLCFGIAILFTGVCLTVIAGLGFGAGDLLMFALGRKGVSLKVARWAIEISALVIGVLLGGSAGVATILIALSAGPVIVRLIPRVATLPLVAVKTARRTEQVLFE